MNTTPYWTDSADLPKFKTLSRNLKVDVVVVGGGITGITAAYLLKSRGRTVALVERGRCGGGDTGHTTAHLTYVTDTQLSELVKAFGRDHAVAVWDAGRAALMQIDGIIHTEHLACEFDWVIGYLHASLETTDPNQSSMLKEEASLAAQLGFDATYLDAVPFINRPGVAFEGQAKFHPLRYLAGLLKVIPGDGSHVFEGTEVEEVQDSPLAVKAGGHTIDTDYVVIATHNPLVGKASMLSASLLQTKLYLYTSYAIGGKVPSGLIPEASFWDTSDPYYYLRIDRGRDHDYLIFGGADHKTGQAEDTRVCFAHLEQALRHLVPEIEVTHRWSGQVIETQDGLPYIGETADHQFAATGFSGNGLTFGTLAGMMACDAALRRQNPWRELFDIRRTTLSGAWDYLRENSDYPYYLIRDWFAGADGKSLRAVKRGQGKILELDGERVAASRNDEGLSVVSAVCTHMGCIVDWNEAERTWDCPCHGSRFAASGEVLGGPAETRLKEIEVGKKRRVPAHESR